MQRGRLAGKVAAIALVAWFVERVLERVLLADSVLGRVEGVSAWRAAPWQLTGTILIAASLAFPAWRSRLSGRRLAAALFTAVVGIHVVLVTMEGLFFLHTVPARDLLLAAVRDTVVAALLALAFAHTFDAEARPAAGVAAQTDRLGWWWWAWRFGLCSISYVVLYGTAGALIWPHIRSFYEESGLVPDPRIVLPLQVVRGTLYVLFALPILRSLVVPRWQASLAMAVMFPLLAGVAALLAPNPILTDAVRGWHLYEIAWSNFAFGALVGALFWTRRSTS